MWWTQAASVPVLVTTSSPQYSGRLGVGDTIPLVSGPFGQTFHSGARFTLGRWFGDDQIRGIDIRGFFLGQSGTNAPTPPRWFHSWLGHSTT
ncbi:MAG: BBP7 family outer membrane beta-barrel protein [Gemmataceae bacterium]